MASGVTLAGIARQSAAWTATAQAAGTLVLRCRNQPTERRLLLAPEVTAAWSRRVGKAFGVQLRFTPRARAALSERRARVVTFNHCSTYDIICVGGVLPPGGVIVAKNELRTMPFIGAGLTAIGTIFLDRGDRQAAYASLERAARRMREERLQVVIAPEGQRSETPELQRFRLGAFQLSAFAQVPIQPLVFHGAFKVWPKGAFAPTPGRVIVDALEELTPPESTDRQVLIAFADRLRAAYAEALAKGPDLSQPG